MAKQIQDEKVLGTVDWANLTFYKRGEDYFVKQKSSLKSKRVKKSKSFTRTRENANEFALCSGFGAMVRLVLREVVAGVNGKHQNRMNSILYGFRVLDENKGRGKRRVWEGLFEVENLNKLRNFVFDEYNLVGDLGSKVRAGGYVSRVVGFVPSLDLESPIEATHFEFISVMGQIDLSVDVDNPSDLPFLKDVKVSSRISVLDSSVLNFDLQHDLGVFRDNLGNWFFSDNESRLELFGFGIRFYQNIAGAYYPLRQRGMFSVISNLQLGNDLVVIEVTHQDNYIENHNLGHIPFVWLLDSNKMVSEAVILHSNSQEFSVFVGVSQDFTICYYRRMGVEVPFINTDSVLVTHNLGRYVAIQVLDDVGRVCGAQITQPDLNNFEVKFGALFSGKIVYYP
jgi:hypothetical protein